MSAENIAITVTDFAEHPDSDELILVGSDQFRVMGLSDIWGLIGNLLKFNMIENARVLFDMLVGNPGKYTVEQLITAIKKAIGDLSGKTDQGGPPKLSEGFRLQASSSMTDEVRKELEKRGINTKSMSIMTILGIASMIIRYGPGIWDAIMEMFGKGSEPKKGKVKEAAAAITLAFVLLFTGNAVAQVPGTSFLATTVSYLAEPAEHLPEPSEDAPALKSDTNGSEQALDEVNAARAKRGLRALILDPLLSRAAYKAAQLRSERGIHGHLPEGDMTCLPSGAAADAAGCAALDSSWGWQSCCWDDPQYTHAGAAWVMGNDGRRYMHIFVRTEGRASATKSVETVTESSSTCTTGTCSTRSWAPGGIITRGRRAR